MPNRDPSTLRLSQTGRAVNHLVRYLAGGMFTTTAATYVAGGATDSILPLPRGWIDGFIMSTDTGNDTDHDINTTAGAARGGTSSDQNLSNLVSTEITKGLDRTWTAGQDGGGLNATDFASGTSGPEANTWYHYFVLGGGSTVDFGFDKNVSATGLLADANVVTAGHTHFRRIGSVYSDASENIEPFFQKGSNFFWVTPVEDHDQTDLADVENEITLNTVRTGGGIPPGVNVEVLMNVVTAHGASAQEIWVYDTDVASATPTADAAPLSNLIAASSGDNHSSQVRVWSDTSQQIALRASTTAVTARIVVLGWYDLRGRE